jgi:Na+/proline symporter
LHETLIVPDGDPDKIYPWFIVHRMPIVAVGLLLASIFAIAMSNASGSLNSLASSSIIDLGRRRTTGTDAAADARSLGRSRVTTLLWGAVLGGLGLVNWGPVLVAGLTIAAITYGAMLGVFLLGTWNRRANETGALVGFAITLVTMILVRLFTPLAFTWYVLLGTVITFAIGSGVSALRPESRTIA